LSRLRFVLAFVALFAVTAVAAGCGDSDDGGDSNADPQAVIESATFEGVKSADVDLSIDVAASGGESGDVAISVSGPFQSTGKGELPELDLEAKVTGSVVSGEGGGSQDIDFEGGLVLFPNSAFVSYQGTDYEVDPTTFSFVQSALDNAQRQGDAEEESATACQEALAGTDIGNFVDNLSNDGGAEVDGVSTTKVSGDLDVAGALDTLTELSEDPACSGQLDALEQLPSGSEVEEAKKEIQRTVKSAHADLYVGEDDIIRRVTAQLTIEPEGEGESLDLSIDLSLAGVNEDQEISAPDDTQPLSELFLDLGVNPLELLGALEGETEGVENLLESLAGGAVGGEGSGGSSPEEQREKAFMKCLQGVSSAADLQKCDKLK
jgi:hypothetical protein